jgi:glycosyltransferase involved in cell wall biosynthesis
MRFVESATGLLKDAPDAPRRLGAPSASEPLKVLLFGTWGPQKDLEGAIAALRPMVRPGGSVQVTVAGAANPNFPEHARRLERLAQELPPPGFTFIGRVEDEDVPSVFLSHDVLLLPYHAAGGYSGVMNLGAAYGIPVIAYDHAQLRECAVQLGLTAVFVPATDPEALRVAVTDAGRHRGERSRDNAGRLAAARQAMERLLDLVAPA